MLSDLGRTTENKPEGGAATQGSAPAVRQRRPGPIERLASVRLTLWLLAILVIAMALATLIPQNAPTEAYLKVLGTLFGPLVAKTALRNIYGAWWFIGAFALLGINLLACSVQRTARLLRSEGQAPGPVSSSQVMSRATNARWRITGTPEGAAGGLAQVLQRHGYRTFLVDGEREGQRGLAARRGWLSLWTPVIVHVGLVVVLIGAAWGRLPTHVYRTIATLQAGETFPVRFGEDAFGLRLVSAGTERDTRGQPTQYWTKVEVVEERQTIRSETIRSNRPLRYHAVTAILHSLMPVGYQIEISKGESRGDVPIVVTEHGVDAMGSHAVLTDPAWVVVVTDFRTSGEQGLGGPAAEVLVDTSGPVEPEQMRSHNWQLVGWVDNRGLDYAGAHFQLIQAGESAQLSLDRDVGIPVVFLGFIIIALGTVLLLGSGRRTVIALVSPKGQGSEVLAGVSWPGSRQEGERLLQELQEEVGGGQRGTSSEDRGKP